MTAASAADFFTLDLAELDDSDGADLLAELDAATPAPEPPRQLVTQLSTVEPEAVSWLWKPYIPRRKLTFLEGDPGGGKTFAALTVAAAITRGAPLPGDQRDGERAPGSVLFWTCEDGIGDTLRPRFDKADGDATRFYVLNADRPDGSLLTLDDTAELREACEQVLPALMVIDPIQGALGAKVDAHRANEVRPRLTRLKLLAEQFDCAVLILRHLSKAPQSKAIHRGLGSIDFAAAARSILLLGADPEDENRRALVQVKNSLAPHGPPLDFTISDGAVTWSSEPSRMTAAGLLAPELVSAERSAADEATIFLAATLADGPVAALEVLADARNHGVARRTLFRAKAASGVRSVREGGAWYWKAATVPTSPNTNGGTVGTVEKDEAAVGENQECQECQEPLGDTLAPLPDEDPEEWEGVQ